MAGKDVDVGLVAEHVADRDAFLDKGDEETLCARFRQDLRSLCCSDAIRVSLDDGGRLYLVVRQGIKGTPV